MEFEINSKLKKKPKILWLEESNFFILGFITIIFSALLTFIAMLKTANVFILLPIVVVFTYRTLRKIEKKYGNGILFRLIVFRFNQKRYIKVANFKKNLKIK